MNRERHTPTAAKLARALGPAVTDERFKMPPKSKPCGKRRCRNYEHAVAYALWLTRKTSTPLRPYQCPTCEGWHLTKRPTWQEERP